MSVPQLAPVGLAAPPAVPCLRLPTLAWLLGLHRSPSARLLAAPLGEAGSRRVPRCLVQGPPPQPDPSRTHTPTHTLLAHSHPPARSFPSLEKRAKQRPSAVLRVLTAADPILDPITRGFLRMVVVVCVCV